MGATRRGVRDGTGPHKQSAQRQTSKIGKRGQVCKPKTRSK